MSHPSRSLTLEKSVRTSSRAVVASLNAANINSSVTRNSIFGEVKPDCALKISSGIKLGFWIQLSMSVTHTQGTNLVIALSNLMIFDFISIF